MACYHPLRGAYTNIKTPNGKKQVKVFPEATTGNKFVFQNRAKPDVFYTSDYPAETGNWRKLDTFLIPCGPVSYTHLDVYKRQLVDSVLDVVLIILADGLPVLCWNCSVTRQLIF